MNIPLEAGHFYITKSGLILMYIGRSVLKDYVYYIVGVTCLDNTNQVIHGDMYTGFLNMFIQSVLSKPVDETALKVYKPSSNPVLLREYTQAGVFHNCLAWYASSKLMSGNNLPVLSDDVVRKPSKFVNARSLQSGVAYKEDGTGKVFLYFGRCWGHGIIGETKYYMWLEVDNEAEFSGNAIKYIGGHIRDIFLTEKNKKVRYHSGRLNIYYTVSELPELRDYLNFNRYLGW